MLRDVPIIGDWIAEAEDKREAEIRQELEETGVVSAWIAEAEIKSKRETTLHILTKRLGALPNDLVERIQKADATWCEKVIDRALEVESVTELHWEELA